MKNIRADNYILLKTYKLFCRALRVGDESIIGFTSALLCTAKMRLPEADYAEAKLLTVRAVKVLC